MAVGDVIYGSPAPSFFKVIIHPHKLEIPIKFMKKYGHLLASSDKVNLNTSTGENWQVKLTREKNKVLLQDGWSKFVEFYSISRGQFLVFTYQGNSSFNVLIFNTITASEIEYPIVVNSVRAHQKREFDEIIDGVPTSSKKELSVPATILANSCRGLTRDEKKRVDAYQCRHPSFMVKITPSGADFRGRVKVPVSFVEDYLKKLFHTFKTRKFRLGIGTGKKTWPVVCVSSGGGKYVQFSSGWKDFALENKLKMDDVCIFELIVETMLFIVTIFPCCTTHPARDNTVKVKPMDR